MVEDLARIEIEGEIAIVRLSRGTTNAISPDLVSRLAEIIGWVGGEAKVRGLVLTGDNDKFFSIGFDLPLLVSFSPTDFASFYRAFNLMCLSLYTLPKPTVAAISGHATAGGCILALCCDHRFVVSGRKLLGLNEIKLGVPVPYAADRILRETVGSWRARRVVESGEFFPPEAALELGLVDEIAPPQELLQKAMAKVRSLGAVPGPAFAEIKHSRTQDIEKQIRSRLDETDKAFVECWYSQPARAQLKEALAKF